MSLGKRLKAERAKKGWSQIYVSEKVGITNTVLSNYERDYRDPDTETLKKIAELYDVSVDYLLGRTDNKEHEDSNQTQVISTKDQRIIDKFMKLSDKDKAILIELMERMQKD